MISHMNGGHLQTVGLDDLGVVRFAGADAARFLQGQLSNDIGRVSAERSVLAGFHNPQGRAIALLRIVQIQPNDFLTLLPRELAPTVADRLAKYVLRAKVKVSDDSPGWRITGLIACERGGAEPRLRQTPTASLDAYPAVTGEQRRVDESVVICVGDQPARWLLIAPLPAAGTPAASDGVVPHSVPARREVWRQLDIIAGLPQVYGATSEEFVAQMLNLDVLGAIAFDKGCYTGQEVIARAHYRGRVKRRLQRFRSRGPLDLKPGDKGEQADGRAFTVVEAVRLEDGRCEFLAVAPLPTTEPELSAASQPADLSATGAVWAPFASSPAGPQRAGALALPSSLTEALPHDLERLELPYSLPS